MRRLTFVFFFAIARAAILIDKDGCGHTKGCLFKPSGCDPNLDCTIGLVFHVVGPNALRVQLVGAAITSAEALQYVAIGFSKDQFMGDDVVTQCVIPTSGDVAGPEAEIHLSYNDGKSNQRLQLSEIVPQVITNEPNLWDLNQDYYIMGATGRAQPGEILAHGTERGSHFFPIVSTRPINPSLVGERQWPLPKRPTPVVPSTETSNPQQNSQSNDVAGKVASAPPLVDAPAETASTVLSTMALLVVARLL